jgi:hypothetical protein
MILYLIQYFKDHSVTHTKDTADGINSSLPPLIFAVVAIGSGDMTVSAPSVQAIYPEQALSAETLEVR